MNLPELSINRHVLAYMFSGVILLFGIISFTSLPVDRYPNVDIPVVSITTKQLGANPSIIDSSITNVIERKVNSVPGIDFIQSNSSPGVSIVTIAFVLEKDIDVAFNEVQSKVNQILDDLPDDADPPVIAKVETDASPVVWLHLQGNRTLQQLNLYANNVLRRQLENIDGVGDIRVGGQLDRTIRVELHPDRLIAFGLTVQDVIDAFRNEHLLMPGGFVTSSTNERLLKLDLEYHDPRELEEMVVGYRDGAATRLRDVATVIDGLADLRQVARRDGEPIVGMGIVKVSGANTVKIVHEVLKRVEEDIRPQLPPGLTLKLGSDQSTFIVDMVNALQGHLIEGTLLAGLVVLLFLRNLRATLIIAAAIPVSLLGAVAAMYFFDYSFNSMTLLALLLLVGVVVDDAIVVLENIYRHREDIDPDPKSAALNGTQEVMFAVLASTLSLVAIFLPVVFMSGMVGRFFSTFAVVVVCGVLASWFVALTLTPMLCSRYLQVNREHGRIYGTFERVFDSLEGGYRKVLSAGLNHRLAVLVATIIVTLGAGGFLSIMGKEFMPREDESQFMVFFKGPLGSSLDYTDAKMREIEAIFAAEPTIKYNFTAIGMFTGQQVNEGVAFVTMVPRSERDKTQWDVIREMRQKFGGIAGLQAFPTEVPAIGGQRSEPLQFAVRGQSLEQVGQYATLLNEELGKIEGLGRINFNLQLEMPQLQLHVDRVRARSLGLSTRDVALAANVLAGGVDIARYNDDPGDGERYDIRLKGAEGVFRSPSDLSKIYLRSDAGELVRLDTVARFEEILGPARIDRLNLQYAALSYADPEIPLGEAMAIVEQKAHELMPLGLTIEFLGSAREFERTLAGLIFVFVTSVILLYMVLASQFDSFIQPLIIMAALPLAMTGGLGGLYLVGHTLNIYSMIGLILLIGLVAKNSILLVDLTNQRRAQGMNIREALLDACPIRMRPVLMTSLTVILAMLPAAIGIEAGSGRNGPLAVAVISGMISSTLLTLVVIPVAYSLVENGLLRLQKRRAARHDTTKTPQASA